MRRKVATLCVALGLFIGAAAIVPRAYAVNYTVTFNNNGGAFLDGCNSNDLNDPHEDLPSQVAADGYITLEAANNCVSKSANIFMGWNTVDAHADAGEVDYPDQSKYNLTGNVTMYAVWGGSVVFDGNSGSCSDAYQVEPIGANNLDAENCTRSGWDFKRWNTASNDSGTPYNDGVSYTFGDSAVLYAIWVQRFTVTYDHHGGTGDATCVGSLVDTCDSGSTKAGYTFNGWFAAASGGSAIPYPFEPTATVTHHAQWTLLAPVFTDMPGLAWGGGKLKIGSTINVPSYTYVAAEETVTHEWFRCGPESNSSEPTTENVSGCATTGDTVGGHTVVSADKNKTLRIRVKIVNSAGTAYQWSATTSVSVK